MAICIRWLLTNSWIPGTRPQVLVCWEVTLEEIVSLPNVSIWHVSMWTKWAYGPIQQDFPCIFKCGKELMQTRTHDSQASKQTGESHLEYNWKYLKQAITYLASNYYTFWEISWMWKSLYVLITLSQGFLQSVRIHLCLLAGTVWVNNGNIHLGWKKISVSKDCKIRNMLVHVKAKKVRSNTVSRDNLPDFNQDFNQVSTISITALLYFYSVYFLFVGGWRYVQFLSNTASLAAHFPDHLRNIQVSVNIFLNCILNFYKAMNMLCCTLTATKLAES